MSYKHIFFAAGLLMLAAACAKVETEPAHVPATGPETISIPIVCEEEPADTKAYLHNDQAAGYWTYVWEYGDYFHYFYSNGSGYADRFAPVTKTPNATLVDYAASDLQIGKSLYSFYIQKDLLGIAETNNDPSAIKMIIPTYQVSNKNPEYFYEQIDATFDIVDLALDKLQDTGSESTLEEKKVPSRTVSFKIQGYNPEFEYSCELVSGKSISNFTYDENGNASVLVNFNNYTYLVGTTSKTKFKVVNATYPENSVTIEVTATRNGLASDSSNYTVQKTGSSEGLAERIITGEVKAYNIREAMPCASRSKVVTSSLLRYPTDIANSMTIYMLGSAAEFRVYSGTTGAHVGEDILMAYVTTYDKPCAGECYYDMISENLTLFGFDDTQESNYTIYSDVSALGYKVPAAKNLNESFFMVIAPGTYSGGRMAIVTKDADGNKWEYRFKLSSNPFTRATKKPLSINLDNGTRVPYVDPNEPVSEEEEEEEAA